MILLPNCKINIGLHILRRREDGYHDLETIFYPIYGLHDTLEVTPILGQCSLQSVSFHQDGLQVDCSPEDNLIVRCYNLMAASFTKVGPVDIRLHKNIPFGAGLGGGSSDAAHTAIALNQVFSLGLSKQELIDIVTPLGADCAFFIHNIPCFATGIGNKLSPLSFSLAGKYIVLVKPPINVSTREAYAGIVPWDRPLLPDAQFCLYDLHNDFERSVFPLYLELASIKQQLLDMGAIYAAMSGSGSTIYGIFDSAVSHIPVSLSPFVIYNGILQ